MQLVEMSKIKVQIGGAIREVAPPLAKLLISKGKAVEVNVEKKVKANGKRSK